ncbi:MAG: Acetyltransferase, GNAT family [Ktedonobacterales bacterium]|jgi:mycothiol synthase|nr:MAG: Acetyltransferase, GNAT family [Ktedonobacterales bacterium]
MTTSTIVIPAGYALRHPTREDIPALIALIDAHDRAHYGVSDPYTEEDILGDWKHLKAETDAWVMMAANGEIAGYATATDWGYGQLGIDGYVNPKHWGHGIGTALVRLAEARLRDFVDNAPEGARVVADNGVILSDEPARRLHEGEGYTLARTYWRMQIDMDSPPPAPEWPEGITLRTMERGRDERAIFDCVEQSFADHWGHVPRKFEEWIARTERSDFDPSLWFLAVEGEQIAGVALCSMRPDGSGWVGTLGVRRPWRQKGLGRALLLQAFGEFYRRGVMSVALGVDAQSLTGATRLYEKAGMHVVMQFARYEKELRAGVDMSTQTLSE